ncbi:Endopolyphosphatase [Gaertneriomyces sp. JEL0708]|nr:Endopolyphosphatase [Gaertneriomyces sp. JEL0708]
MLGGTTTAVLALLGAFSGTLSLPARQPQTPMLWSHRESAKFLHITDMHLDPYYTTGAPVSNSCHEPQRQPTTRKGRANDDRLAGPFGTPGSPCDSPLPLINETMRFIHDILLPELSFVVWTGDSARHDSDSKIPRKEDEIRLLNSVAVRYIVSAASSGGEVPDIPVIPNIGNNDIYPHNDLAFTPGIPNDTLDYYVGLWSQFIPPSQIPGFRTHGSFAVDVNEHLIVASLNTMYLSNSNKLVGDCLEGGPGNVPDEKRIAGDTVLSWLEQLLHSSSIGNKAVYIIGHVPPNQVNLYPTCYKRFASIMEKYVSTVKGQFYGHMNVDHHFFPITNPLKPKTSETPLERPASYTLDVTAARIPSWLTAYYKYLMEHYTALRGHQKAHPHYQPPAPVFVSPSVVPSFNPSLRVFTYSVDSGDLNGYNQYYVDLERVNALASNDTTADPLYPVLSEDEFPGYIYETLYDPVRDYGMKGFRFEDWVKLGGRMNKDSHKGRELKRAWTRNLVAGVEGLEDRL